MVGCTGGHDDCEIDLLQELMNRLGPDVWPALRALEQLPEASPEQIIAMADIFDVSPTVLLALGTRRAILRDDHGKLPRLGERPAVGRGNSERQSAR